MQFIKTTIIGGLVFLVPLVIVVAIVGKALEIMLLVAKPFDKFIPADAIGGVAMANVLALLAIAISCFIAGILARSALAKRAYHALDEALLTVPGYAFIKGFTDSMNSSEKAAKGFQPVFVQFDDNAQIGFEVERTGGKNVVVYLPGAPNPWSGSVAYFNATRVKQLDMSVAQAFQNIRQLGRGSTQYSDLG